MRVYQFRHACALEFYYKTFHNGSVRLLTALVVLVLLGATFLALPSPTRASYSQAYSDYTYAYNQYRSSHDAYLISKSTFATYRTLTAQTDAIDKLRTVLQNRNTLMSVYYDLLQEKMADVPTIDSQSKGTFFNVKESEKKWLNEQKIKIDAAASLEDLNKISGEFEGRYPQMDTETKQAVGSILIAKITGYTNRWDKLSTDLSNELKVIGNDGEDTAGGQRGIISARNKRDLSSTKIDEAKAVLWPRYSSYTIDLLASQQKLIESTQYLREATSYLLEVVKDITG